MESPNPTEENKKLIGLQRKMSEFQHENENMASTVRQMVKFVSPLKAVFLFFFVFGFCVL